MKDHRRNDLDQLLVELDDLDPIVRQEAAMALGDFCPKDHPAVNVLIERLHSPQQTPNDRTCAAWALGRIWGQGVRGRSNSFDSHRKDDGAA